MSRTLQSSTFNTFDNVSLTYYAWLPGTIPSKKAVILIHRGHEHTLRLKDAVEGFVPEDAYCFGFDARGHGKSPGLRGYADDFSVFIKDFDTFVHFICTKYNLSAEDIVVVANSIGGVVASTWVHDYAPRIAGLVLVAPAFKVHLYVPFALTFLKLINSIKRPFFISSYVKSQMLTHDKVEQKKYNDDPLISKSIAVNVLLGMDYTAKRIVSDASVITTPVLLLSSEKDFVASNSMQEEFFKKLASEKKTYIRLHGFYHGILFEKQRSVAYAHISSFIEECFSSPKSNNIETSYLNNEYKSLLKGASGMRKYLYKFTQLVLSSLGRLSDGINIGVLHGFDSGRSLDHIYTNVPSGKYIIGTLFDYFYINSVGWRGIRIRKENLKELLRKAINSVKKSNKPITLLDIASGTGRYLCELALEYPDVSFIANDISTNETDHGKRLAESMNCGNITYMNINSMTDNSADILDKNPDIVIVSGLYELYASADEISKSITWINKVLADGGILIYTGQPWHPQLEFIANALTNRNKEKWVMRRRSQAELDKLISSHGFEKLSMEIDNMGIFTVSMAKKI